MKLQYNENAEYMERFLRDYIEAHQLEQSRIALDIALRMHRDQKRTEGLPYVIHPMTLALHGISLGMTDDNLMAVMLLHDVCEDCPVCPDELPVNEIVRRGVDCITKKHLDGEAKLETMQRYMKDIRGSREACIAKVFDRCHNVSSMAGVFSEKRLQAYITETKDFIYPLMEHVKEDYPEYDTMMYALEYQITSIIKSLETKLHQ